MFDTTKPLTIGIIAGEVSGDVLGGDFMAKMNRIHPNITWVGVGGVTMSKQGLSSVIDMSRLSVMGIGEVIKHLPDLLSAKKEISSAFAQADIDIFVGIDAPDFNLRLGKVLKPKGVFCVQYVSPSVWAWREGRIHTIKKSTDLVLCLFPFELPVYAKHKHPAVCVGHPLIKSLRPITREQAIAHLGKFGIAPAFFDQKSICLMAGSRVSEIDKILPLLLDGFDKLSQCTDRLSAIIPVAKSEHIALVEDKIAQTAPKLAPHITIISPKDGASSPAHLAMQACDLTLLASGTATLEALLLNAPMVVVYRVSNLTYHIAKRLLKIPFVALPNILSHHQNGTAIVPELLQDDANPDKIEQNAIAILDNPNLQKTALQNLSQNLTQHATANPAEVVLQHYHAKQ